MEPTVALFVDALSHQTIDPEVAPTLASWRAEDRLVDVDPVFGFKGVAVSMFTGVPPSEHGVWTDFRIASDPDPDDAGAWPGYEAIQRLPFSLPRKALLTAYERVRRDAYVTPHRVPSAVRPHLEPAFEASLTAPDAVPGHGTIFDAVREAGGSVHAVGLSGGVQSRILRRIPEVAGRDEDLVVVKYNGLDHLGHEHGPGSPELADRIREVDRRIRETVDRNPDKRVVVFSDHGMTPVDERVDVAGHLEEACPDLEVGRDYVPFLNSTCAVFRWVAEGARDRILGALEGVDGLRVLGEADLEALGVAGVLPAYGDDVVATELGVTISPDYYASKPREGMHGFASPGGGRPVLAAPETPLPGGESLTACHDLIAGALDL